MACETIRSFFNVFFSQPQNILTFHVFWVVAHVFSKNASPPICSPYPTSLMVWVEKNAESSTESIIFLSYFLFVFPAQSTEMLFSSWATWAAGDWWRRQGMFLHLRFYSNGFPVAVQRFNSVFCMVVLLMTTGQSRFTIPNTFVIFFCNFRATRRFLLV